MKIASSPRGICLYCYLYGSKMVVKLALYAVDCVGLAVVAMEIRLSVAAPKSAAGRKRVLVNGCLVEVQLNALSLSSSHTITFMKIYPRRTLLSLGLISLAALGGCANSPKNQQVTLNTLVNLANQSIEQQFPTITPIDHSIVRTANGVSLAIRNTAGIFQVTVACDKPQAWLMYADVPLRKYPRGQKYTEPVLLELSVAEKLRDFQPISNSCKTVPDWRILRAIEGTKEGVLLDISTVIQIGPETVAFWAAFDYPLLAHDVPYDAPYGQKFEKFVVNCDKRTYAEVAGYDIDASTRVTDGALTASASQTGFDKTDDDYRLLFKQVCDANSKRADELPHHQSIAKKFTDAPNFKPPVEDVVKAVQALGISPPLRTVHKIVTAGESTYQSEISPLRQTWIYKPTSTPGLWRIWSEAGYKGESLSFLGLINLSSFTTYSTGGTTGSSLATDIKLTGNWQQMSVGSLLSYQTTDKNLMSDSGAYGGTPRLENCKIEEALQAATLHPAISGIAKRITCLDPKDEYKRVMTIYYLVDYGVMFHQSISKNKFYHSTEKIVEFE